MERLPGTRWEGGTAQQLAGIGIAGVLRGTRPAPYRVPYQRSGRRERVNQRIETLCSIGHPTNPLIYVRCTSS